MQPIPVIAIDGPSASGKGSVAEHVARRLGFHYLDSGAIYRAAAVAAVRAGEDGAGTDGEARLAALAGRMDLEFRDGRILMEAADITADARSEAAGRDASRIAALPSVRLALLERQRAFRRAPGLVADGRDMGSVVFPDARLKVFLTADVTARAHRRALQLAAAQGLEESPKGLIDKEKDAIISPLFDALRATVQADLEERDRRDSQRAAAPLMCLPDALRLDTTGLSIDEAVATVEGWFRSDAGRRQPLEK